MRITSNFTRPVWTVVCSLLLAYVVFGIARLAFWIENWSLFAGSIGFSHALELWRGGLLFDTSAILYTNVLWVALVLFPWHKKETRSYHTLCRWVFVVINTLSLAVNLIDSVYFRFTMRRTTTTVFQEFRNEDNLSSIFLTETLSHWYFLLLTVFVCWLLWKCYMMPFRQGSRPKPKTYYPTMILALLLFVPCCIAGMRGGWTRQVRPITIANANNYCKSPTEVGIVVNTPFSLIRTIGKNNFEVPAYFATEEELASVYSPVHSLPRSLSRSEERGTRNENSSVGKGNLVPPSSFLLPRKKNIVVLIVESFGREYIGGLNPASEETYTPFVDSLITRSLTFTHTYCNGRKSIDGMPSILSSIPMFVEPFFLSPYSVNDVSGLARCLGSKGYTTAFFHGAARGSMGFLAFANATKFADYYGREDFERDVPTATEADFDGYWGISDEPFLQYFCTKMTQMKQPFMTALFTLSSHHPFQVPEPYREQFPEEALPIHKVIRYTDMALRRFFEAASRQPWYANTIFVLTSDHTNMSNHAEYQTALGGFAVPIIFFDPSGEMGVGMRDGIAQQTDIMPTLLDYLGYDQPYVSFGKNLLTTPAEETWAVNYLNGIYQYVKYGYVLQFDGEKTIAVYSLDDRLMTKNIVGQVSRQAQMERELKAIIQQYMERMTQNRLM
jgi:arylsulfatase A-like enzyme